MTSFSAEARSPVRSPQGSDRCNMLARAAMRGASAEEGIMLRSVAADSVRLTALEQFSVPNATLASC